MDRAEKIVRDASSYVVSTLDKDSFPLNITLSKILERSGCVTLFFYLDEHSKSVDNMKRRPRGSVSCFVEHNDRIETLNLKGTFTIEPEWKVRGIINSVEDTNPTLKSKEAVIVVFETLNFEIEVVNKLV